MNPYAAATYVMSATALAIVLILALARWSDRLGRTSEHSPPPRPIAHRAATSTRRSRRATAAVRARRSSTTPEPHRITWKPIQQESSR